MGYDSTPAHRVSRGTALSPRGLNDAVLRKVGHTTGDIRLAPSAATIVGSSAYNLGKADAHSVGVYVVEYQNAATASGKPLGAKVRVEFEIYESSAGVFAAKISRVGDSDGGLAAAADGHQVNDDADAEWSATAVADNTKAFLVMDSTAVTAYSGVATGVAPTKAPAVAVGDVLLFDGSADLVTDATTYTPNVYSITRIR